MKNSLKLLALFVVFAAVGFVLSLTGNPLAALATLTVVGSVANLVVPFMPAESGLAMMCTALIGLKRECQKVNTGGIKKLYFVLVEDLENEVFTFEQAKATGELTTAIPMKAGKTFIEIEAWYDTAKIGSSSKIGAGFSQNIEFKYYGMNKDTVRLQALLYDAPVNVIAEGIDGVLYYVGLKDTPLFFETTGSIPEKGTARKEITFVANLEGAQVPVFPLASSVTIPLTVEEEEEVES